MEWGINTPEIFQEQEKSHDQKSGKYLADLVELNFEGKSVGLTALNLNKGTVARFFNVHEKGLHLKVIKTGKWENVWLSSNR